jgi:hypothetical protein
VPSAEEIRRSLIVDTDLQAGYPRSSSALDESFEVSDAVERRDRAGEIITCWLAPAWVRGSTVVLLEGLVSLSTSQGGEPNFGWENTSVSKRDRRVSHGVQSKADRRRGSRE